MVDEVTIARGIILAIAGIVGIVAGIVAILFTLGFVLSSVGGVFALASNSKALRDLEHARAEDDAVRQQQENKRNNEVELWNGCRNAEQEAITSAIAEGKTACEARSIGALARYEYRKSKGMLPNV